MELDREVPPGLVDDTFVGAIIEVLKVRTPTGRQCIAIYGEAVILAGDKALISTTKTYRLIG